MNIIFKAVEFATKAHEGQMRKGTNMPYIMHPFSVALYLQRRNCSTNTVIAALFHDILEDTQVTPEQIETNFGADVLTIVLGCTDEEGLKWKERKLKAIEKYKTASIEIKIVSLSDKLHNLSSIVNDLKRDSLIFENGKFEGYKENYLWYFTEILNVFSAFKSEPIFNNVYSDYGSTYKEFRHFLEK